MPFPTGISVEKSADNLMGVTLTCYFVIFAFNLPSFLSFFPLLFFLIWPLKYTLFIVVFLFWTDIFSLPPTSCEASISSYTQENYKQLTSVPAGHIATYQFCFLPMINSLSLSDSQSQHKDSIIQLIFPFFSFLLSIIFSKVILPGVE